MPRTKKIIHPAKTRKISVDAKRKLYPEEIKTTEYLANLFSRDEFQIQAESSEIKAELILLDPDSLLHAITQSCEDTGLNAIYLQNNEKNLFQTLFDDILSIKSYGIKSGKRLYTGYADERKVEGRKEKEKIRGSHFYTQGHKFRREKNPLPDGYENKILCGDSEVILKSLPDNCIDLIITSPPYNFGLDYGASEDGIDWTAYLDKLYRIFREGIRVLSWGGRFIVNVQPLFSDYIPLHHLISSFFMENNMIWKGEIIWEKNNYNCKYTAWGSWKSPSSPYLKYTWEFIEVFCKGDLKKPGLSENADISDEEFKSWVVAKWSIGPERRMKEYNHPAMFPEELVERCMKLFSFQGDIILDPFSGAGTTAFVANRLNRKYIGIDISSEYCERAKKRLNSSNELKSKKILQSKPINTDLSEEEKLQLAKKKGERPLKKINNPDDQNQIIKTDDNSGKPEKKKRGRPKKSASLSKDENRNENSPKKDSSK